MRECCVQCGNETIYDFTDHIDMRYGYIEGLGQYCITCYNANTRTIKVPVRLIIENPNDAQLGNAVRKLFWESGD